MGDSVEGVSGGDRPRERRLGAVAVSLSNREGSVRFVKPLQMRLGALNDSKDLSARDASRPRMEPVLAIGALPY